MADRGDIRQAPVNWLTQATSSEGRFVDGVVPSAWVADQFLAWWRAEVDEDLGAAEAAIEAVRAELRLLGGGAQQQLGEALHELTHADEALSRLRSTLGLADDGPAAE